MLSWPGDGGEWVAWWAAFRKRLIKQYLIVFFLLVQGKWQVRGSIRCSAWPWTLPDVPTAWHSPCGVWISCG